MPVDRDFARYLTEFRHDLRTPAGHIIGYAELIAEDLTGIAGDETVRDLRAIAASGERLVSMIEEHLGAAKRRADELDLATAHFELRSQLNHIAGYTEMLAEATDDGPLLDDLGRITTAVQLMVGLIERRLTPDDVDSTAASTRARDREEPGEVELHPLAQGGHILVVDDDPTNRELLGRRLRRFGFEVSTAGDGVSALAAASDDVDLVVMDLVMDGWSGLDTLRRLKAGPTRDVPVLMLSSADDPDDMVDCVLAGADDYLISPIRPVLLLTRIGAVLEKSRLRRRFTRQLRIFISSPGDVIPERRLLKRVIRELDREYGHDVQLVPILWEEEPLVASETFQAQIIEPHATDIYVAIVWSRIGSPLPATMSRPDGTRYDSGTAYEFEDAMDGYRRTGRPHMLMYRKISTPSVALDDRAAVLDRLDQVEKLDRYVERWFIGDDGSYVGAFHEFADAEQLETMASLHLRKLVDRWLEEEDGPSG